MVNFAFIHNYSENPLMGKLLTHSIKEHHPNSPIIGIQGEGQVHIKNLDFLEKWKFSKENIMFDCVSSQLYVVKKYGPTVFLDADMILIKPIKKFISNKSFDMTLTQRSKETMIKYLNNNAHQKKFPQLLNKTFGEAMPYNAGIYFCQKKEALEYMVKSFATMEKEYFEWYGDQIALNKLVKSNFFKINFLEESLYNFTPKDISEDTKDKYILHFKGRRRNLLIPFFKKIFGESLFENLYTE